MARTTKPENQVYGELRTVVQEARKTIGLPPERGYRKSADDGKIHSLAYFVRYKGQPPHYATADQKPNEVVEFDDVWGAIWLAVGSSDQADLGVLIRTEDADGKVASKQAGSIKVAPAQTLLADSSTHEFNDKGVLVKG